MRFSLAKAIKETYYDKTLMRRGCMSNAELTPTIIDMVGFFGSQAALARAAKVKPPAVNQWLKNITKPDSRALHNIQRASKGKYKAKEIRPELF